MIRIITWNTGGAKFLKETEEERQKFKAKLNNALRKLSEDFEPHFIVLQEIVKYGDASNPQDPIECPKGYFYDASIAIDTTKQSHPTKWKKFYKEGSWDPLAYLAQGYGILWRQDFSHSSIWDFTPHTGPMIEKEIVHLDTGLFTGDRNSEPRLAVVTHFVFEINHKPVDFFVINLHLTTLKGEREGFPNKDSDGSKIRCRQIDIVMNGIVSRYNEWLGEKQKEINRSPAIWILAGDFNCTPTSPEVRNIERLNFIDLNPNKGTGTKGKGVPVEKATITLDYIFAGPSYYALDPYFVKKEIEANPLPLYQIKVSDHFPVFANVPIIVK